MSTPSGGDVGAFLQARRAGIQPGGPAPYGPRRRRVPGLRREELAAMAGVSISYYTRIEQGKGGEISPAVLDALARALELSPDERAHLHRLARRPGHHRPPAPEHVRSGLASLVRSLQEVPGGVLGRSMDVLAWNPLCHEIFAPFVPIDAVDDPDRRPNWARLLLCEPRCRAVFEDWPRVARDLAGRLRVASVRQPGDPRLTELVDGLTRDSPAFTEIWDAHPAIEGPLGRVSLRHPRLGELHLRDEIVRSADEPDQILVSFHPEPGAAEEAALRTLSRELASRRDRT